MKQEQLRNWNERYLTENTPWRHDVPHAKIIEFVEKYTAESSKVLEIGCGTGAEAIALDKFGFEVLAIDLAPKAIEIAAELAKQEHSRAKFQIMDFMEQQQELSTFATAIDAACMHTFTEPESRQQFATYVANHLDEKGIWINLSCAKPAVAWVTAATGVESPPALSLTELASAAERHFILLEIASISMPVKRHGQPTTEFPAWVSVFQKIVS